MKHSAMVHASSFRTVESIGRTLPDVEVTTTWGQPALKVRGKMFACMASHKSAEANTLVVMMDIADRDALIADDPGVYYLKEHYVSYPCVLVRLSRIHPDALRDLVTGAHRFVSAKARSHWSRAPVQPASCALALGPRALLRPIAALDMPAGRRRRGAPEIGLRSVFCRCRGE
jgi:hypothetical protein